MSGVRHPSVGSGTGSGGEGIIEGVIQTPVLVDAFVHLVNKFIDVLKTADGGCDSCVSSLIEKFIKEFNLNRFDIRSIIDAREDSKEYPLKDVLENWDE